jgi:molybdenum cofactor synthesis domain-containing protein
MQARVETAAIVTIGDELTSGDVENTNASWLARRLEALGVGVRLVAAVPDDVEAIGDLLRRHRGDVTHVVVSGGLGGTPDDVTREGVAAAFGVECALDERAAGPIRARFAERMTEYALRWACLPVGCAPIPNPLGGAPGFELENVVVLPGLPSEMRATFESIEARFSGTPIRQQRLAYDLAESDIAGALSAVGARFPDVAVGSYPSFDGGRKRVQLVLKGRDEAALEAATTWLAEAIANRRAPAAGA